jgi:geranylgeranyl pyrophosphate synthase
VNAQALLADAQPYLDELEQRLRAAVASHPGLVERVGTEAVDAGGKRLRPLLIHLVTDDRERALTTSVAIELVHTATLVHDDLIDSAPMRRGRPTAWHAHSDWAARTTGDYLFSRGFAELARGGDLGGVRILSEACLALVRGEALQRQQQHRPDTTVDAYLERISLKTGKLFEAACLLGSRDPQLGRFGMLLGVAFQIADDILDCTGETLETGKVPGTDLREGTPTLPLLLASRDDAVVRAALAGGSLDGALVRVAQTGALDRSRALALDYAQRARANLNGTLRRRELEALADAVVDRNR